LATASLAERQLSKVLLHFFGLATFAFSKKHGIKGFVIPTKSFVKIGITKIFCYNNKMFSSIIKTLGCCSKIYGFCSNKKWGAFDSAKNLKSHRRKRQSVTAKREKSQTPKFV